MFTALAAVLCAATAAADEARLMRFAAYGGDKVIFSYAGDLYSVPAEGGTARRLTSHVGYESFAHVSPDGKTIAFTGQYDGNTEVYVMPAEGGEPRRLTFTGDAGDEMGHRMGPNNIVMGWTADGSRIVFRSRSESFNSFCGQLYTVSAEGGMPEPLPLRNGGFCSYSPDGKRLAYNYVFREFRTWKRYEGGMADDIRIFDFDTKRSEQITSTKRQETFPMWTADGGRIFYLSDRDNDVMNLYMYDLAAKEHRMVTSCADYDIKFPTIWRNTIAYERGGYIYLFDTQTLEERKVEVEIDNDNSYSRTELRDVRDDVTDVAASPRGERLLVCAHGDIFSVPVKEGVTYNMTDTSGAREMNATYSPDGRRMAFVSDRSGEFLIYVQDVAGGRAEPVVEDIATYIFDYRWSPDSKLIVWTDKRNTLNITDVAARRTTEVERSGVSTFGCGAFSPDSRYLVYVRPEQQMNNIVVYDIVSGEKHVVTDGWYNCSNPVFSEDGKYLLFSSSRTFNPIYSSTEWNHAYGSMDKLYILPLAEGAARPFEPVNDAVAAVGTEDAAAQTDAKKTQEKTEAAPETESVVYDFDGTEARIVELPVSTAGRYYNIRMFGNKVYYNRGGNTQMYDLDKREETDLGVGVDFIAGGDKVLVRAGGTYAVMDRPQGRVSALDKGADFGGLKKRIDYREEWRQVYDELWRRMRDFFYDPDMHGVDWKAVHDKYAVLVPHVGHRTDLTYIVGEMIGELNVGHAYSNDASLHMRPHAERIKVGMLGAKFSKDRSGYFRVDSITRGANWNGATRSPLTLPEVDVRAGDYIVAVDGRPLKDVANIYETLVGKAGRLVEMEVNSSPSVEGARKVLVTPLESEAQLNYYAWVERNTRLVNEATGGEVGYIHIPDMGVDGLNEFVKHYYPQLGKRALIIDDRGNGGGNVSPMIIERLQRTPTYYTMHTGQTEGSVNPVGTFVGPLVLLVNEYSASDGDLFPYRFKYNRLGTVIGRRTWGGVVGYSGMVPTVDGGSIVTPSYAPYAADGSEFIIENRGVEPDIEIFNDPYEDFMGEDAQLLKAIEVARERLAAEGREKPAIPDFPVR